MQKIGQDKGIEEPDPASEISVKEEEAEDTEAVSYTHLRESSCLVQRGFKRWKPGSGDSHESSAESRFLPASGKNRI